MLFNVILAINIQLLLHYVSRRKHTLPQYREYLWPRPESDNDNYNSFILKIMTLYGV